MKNEKPPKHFKSVEDGLPKKDGWYKVRIGQPAYQLAEFENGIFATEQLITHWSDQRGVRHPFTSHTR